MRKVPRRAITTGFGKAPPMAEDPAAKVVSLVSRVAGADVPAGYEQTEVPAGYKRTEVGVIPENWDVVSLGELFVFKNGLNKAKHFFGHGIPIVNYMDVFGHSGLTVANLSGRVSLRHQEIANFKVRQGDVFFTRTSETVDDIGVASVMLDDPDSTVFSGFVLRARSRNERLIDLYKQYCFTHRSVRSQIVSNATYTTRALTNGRSLSTVRIAVPTEPEQHAIAEALSDVDGLIESLEALIAKRRAVKTAAVQRLLAGRTRLPGFSGEWERTTMRNVGSIYGGLSGKSQTDFGRGNAKYVTFMDVLYNVIIGSCSVADVVVGSDENQNRVVVGDLLFNSTSETADDLAMGAVVLIDIPDLYLNSFCFGLRVSSRYCPLFIAYLFRGPTGRSLMRALAQGATRYNVSKRQFLDLEIGIPTYSEQRAIADVLSDMDAEIAVIERRLAKVRAFKLGVMQQLLTGRIRLVTTDEIPRRIPTYRRERPRSGGIGRAGPRAVGGPDPVGG